jgi:hypothetical protein
MLPFWYGVEKGYKKSIISVVRYLPTNPLEFAEVKAAHISFKAGRLMPTAVDLKAAKLLPLGEMVRVPC